MLNWGDSAGVGDDVQARVTQERSHEEGSQD